MADLLLQIREQRQLIEKAKRQRRLQDAEDELATMEDSYRVGIG